jgi:tripartite-type tricarboxylate transporter receptor subunit TctC
MNRTLLLAIALGLCLLTPASFAADIAWPARPVRMVVPFPPGGSADAVARHIAKALSDRLGQQFVIDNRAGAAGNIGTDIVAKAAPDGYHLALSTSGPLANNKFLYRNMPYDPGKDLTPVIMVGEIPLVIATHPAVAARDLKEFIELARSNPGKITVGTPGNGSIGHLALELVKLIGKADLVHVPYKGDTPAMIDVLGGAIQAISAPIGSLIPNLQAGKLKGLAVAAKTRFPGLPNLATAAEGGIDVEASVWYGLVGPAGMPKAIVDKLNREVDSIIHSGEGRARLEQFATVVGGGPPGRLASLMATDSRKWQQVIENANVKLD